jgi:hypothetical protein
VGDWFDLMHFCMTRSHFHGETAPFDVFLHYMGQHLATIVLKECKNTIHPTSIGHGSQFEDRTV